MTLQSCQAGSTTGFPLRLSDTLSTVSQSELNTITNTNEITVQWGPVANTTISTSSFTVTGFDSIANNTTLTLGGANYKCSTAMSITRIQHLQFCNDKNAVAECIQSFQIELPQSGKPDIVLITRPIVFNTTTSTLFWNAVDTSIKDGSNVSAPVDLKSLYAYENGELLPSINYQTCLPVKILNYSGSDAITGSIIVRVNVIMSPIYISVNDAGLGNNRIPSKYSFLPSVKNLFTAASQSAIFQFNTGLDTYPSSSNHNYLPLAPSGYITAAAALSKIELALPASLIGQPISSLTTTAPPTLPKSTNKNKQYKCYKINPTKDIQNGQILVDPTTGQSLSQSMTDQAEVEDPEITAALNGTPPKVSGMLPGDIQFILSIIATVLGAISLVAYFWYIKHVFFNLKDLNWGILHTLIFTGLFTGLIIFSVFFDKKS